MTQKRHGHPHNGECGEQICYVTLPYDFVPFAEPEERCYPCTKENVPKHNCRKEGQLSGVITYKINPYSDLAIEIRDKKDGGHFISGSQIRGKVRSNLEILSASYPMFIDKSTMLYRDISKENYRQRIMEGANANNSGIEHSIQAGFLRKVGPDFYVTPARQIGNKNFLSIEEHRLVNMETGKSGKAFYPIYDWRNNDFKRKIDNLQAQIDQKTEQIKRKREQLKEKLTNIQKRMSKLFTEEFSFNNQLSPLRKNINKKNSKKYSDDYQPALQKIKRKLLSNLENIKSNDFDLQELYSLYVERWGLKAEVDLIYSCFLKKNKDFHPYQRNIFFKRTPNNGIEKISLIHTEDISEKGYLFNSTPASSKRSHYFVMEPVEDKKFLVPEPLIDGYNRNFKKIRIPEFLKMDREKIKQFYNIFDHYDELVKYQGTNAGLIVFFKTEPDSDSKEKVSEIGRTPYFKIPYKTQLTDIIGNEPDRVDYANALFGFASEQATCKQEEKDKSKSAYKSRLRFGPADINGKLPKKEKKSFILMTPQASASAMYLQQPGVSLLTYEDKEENPKLNGYKYYHVLKHPLKLNLKKQKEGLMSLKEVFRLDGLSITGKIYFNNLSPEELGLLLISLDCKELLKSKEYQKEIANYAKDIKEAYELIGGAKAYGYGKVKIKVKTLEVENSKKDFQSLILRPTKKINKRHRFVDYFITSMGGEKYFEKVHFRQYIQSKTEVSYDFDTGTGTKSKPLRINWGNLSEKTGNRGGYPKTWRLKPRFE